MRVRLRFLCVLVTLWFVATPAEAQTACKDQSLPKSDPALSYAVVVSSKLVALEKDGCLGGADDPSAKPVLDILKPSTDAEDREDPFRKSALAALGRIGQDARNLHTSRHANMKELRFDAADKRFDSHLAAMKRADAVRSAPKGRKRRP